MIDPGKKRILSEEEVLQDKEYIEAFSEELELEDAEDFDDDDDDLSSQEEWAILSKFGY